jgi:hypothetical protein
MEDHPNLGSNLDDLLDEDGIRAQVTDIAIKRVLAWQLKEAMAEQKLTKTAFAARMKTSRQQLNRVLNPEDNSVSLETLRRAAAVVGRTVRLELA